MKRIWKARLKNQQGFTFVEVLAVVLLLGILMVTALPNYFEAQADAKRDVRKANVRAINAVLALHQYKGNACPATGAALDTEILGNTEYFPDGKPVDPVGGGQTYFMNQYNATRCRVIQ